MYLLVFCALLGLALVALGLGMFFRRTSGGSGAFYPEYPQAQVGLSGYVFRAAVADDMARRARGLSGREHMAEGEAMLFIFSAAMKYSFHMKDMKFPLDIIWIHDGSVVGISENIQPPARGGALFGLRRYKPAAAVDSVLEVNAGLTRKLGVRTGDRVEVVRMG